MSDSSFWGSGWSFPPTFELANHRLNLVHKEANINQSIDIILNTRKGERSLHPSFGSDLSACLFRNIDTTLKGEIADTVKFCLLDYEPRITVEAVEVTILESDAPTVLVSITYTVKKTNTRHNHVYPFSINEGTNLLG